jgi:hypothetical protein
MNIRDYYWEFFVNVKFTYYYYGLYLDNSYKWTRYLNSFLAIAASTSIAAWVIWNQIPLVWAGIIAASQVINAIKGYLPYNDRSTRLSKMLPSLNLMLDEMELLWLDIINKKTTDDEIDKQLKKFMHTVTETINHALMGIDVPTKMSYRELAHEMTTDYIATRLEKYDTDGMSGPISAVPSASDTEKKKAGKTHLPKPKRTKIIMMPDMVRPIPMPYRTLK